MSVSFAEFQSPLTPVHRLYAQRWWWLISFCITLSMNFCYTFSMWIFRVVRSDDTNIYYSIQEFFQNGLVNNYFNFNFFAGHLFLLLTSVLFKRIQVLYTPETRPLSFLILRPGRMLDLLDKISVYDRSGYSQADSRFWNILFVFVQPVYLLTMIFPVFIKMYYAGYMNEWMYALIFTIQFTASVSWVMVIYRVFLAIKPEMPAGNTPPPVPQQATEEELQLVRKQIEKLRHNGLQALIYQVLACMAVVYCLAGYVDWNSVLVQLQALAELPFINKVAILGGFALSLLLLYYLLRITKLSDTFAQRSQFVRWLIAICFFVPLLASVSRIVAISLAGRRWNESMREGQFNYRLKMPESLTVWWAVVFVLFALFNTGYLIELFEEYLRVPPDLFWRKEMHEMVSPFSDIILHLFMMMLIIYTKELEKNCRGAADELEVSYFGGVMAGADKEIKEIPLPGASAE
ncbi:MAG: hypothetical protein MUC87_01185 [Bacteroidia bacterium]|jgi:hypothetical protein|nr:hypothetical protein [Bacteroidia bacterium]